MLAWEEITLSGTTIVFFSLTGSSHRGTTLVGLCVGVSLRIRIYSTDDRNLSALGVGVVKIYTVFLLLRIEFVSLEITGSECSG